MQYLFKKKSERVPDPYLIEILKNELHPIRFGDGRAYFFTMTTAGNWFKYVPIFLHLQRYIRDHQRNREAALRRGERTELRDYRNFTVFPVSTFERHHIRIDNKGLYFMLREIGCPHPRLIRRDGTPKQREELKAADWVVLWRMYFDIDAIERTPQNDNRATIKFQNSIQTDGVAMSFWMERTKFVVVKDENEIMRDPRQVGRLVDRWQRNIRICG
ncbi:uncharacterized protein LOC116351337 [Contarinia nasturtii]|uniref:uncharacterized protein LOC116351337 n=1 Tax=Contarinia nasturtii TaxID=265458 RepID=UPI0012D468F7|nr:uncharacterized protein LOC116351337 [Contarinia nasturtii]